MGQYINIGLATTIYVTKENLWGEDHTIKEVSETLSENLNLDLYTVEETKKSIIFSIKEDVFADNIIDFLKTEYKYLGCEEDAEEIFNAINEIPKKELLKKIEDRDILFENFQFTERGYDSNDISYLSKDLQIYADIVSYELEGKVFLECYSELFKYLKKRITESMTNPLKDALVISIFG